VAIQQMGLKDASLIDEINLIFIDFTATIIYSPFSVSQENKRA
jgi:hypothetical protein